MGDLRSGDTWAGRARSANARALSPIAGCCGGVERHTLVCVEPVTKQKCIVCECRPAAVCSECGARSSDAACEKCGRTFPATRGSAHCRCDGSFVVWSEGLPPPGARSSDAGLVDPPEGDLRTSAPFGETGARSSETQATPSVLPSLGPWHVIDTDRETFQVEADVLNPTTDRRGVTVRAHVAAEIFQTPTLVARNVAVNLARMLNGAPPMGQPKTATHPALLDLFFEVEQHIKKNSTLEMGGRKFKTPSIAKLADALAYARECTEQAP